MTKDHLKNLTCQIEQAHNCKANFETIFDALTQKSPQIDSLIAASLGVFEVDDFPQPIFNKMPGDILLYRFMPRNSVLQFYVNLKTKSLDAIRFQSRRKDNSMSELFFDCNYDDVALIKCRLTSGFENGNKYEVITKRSIELNKNGQLREDKDQTCREVSLDPTIRSAFSLRTRGR